ncbi:hypothetical protein JIQ42_01221 [Leishmania sp. Namibia]|uniref:hypothetical protein n=1 Tax=Leishmania sp. Namibia TaxID=2802991 RepID=UPI001B5D09C5|nr:hypothetical protein JIQ42_01221 [Leishmania sp. Namibia]
MGSLVMGRCRRGAEETYEFRDEYALLDAPIANAEHIPLRLSPKERKIQRLMRGVILASSYTDKVDSVSARKLKNRELLIVKELTNALTGLIVGLDMRKAGLFMRDHEFAPYEEEIRTAIEMCRRYKMMNPDLLRTDYVKFLYMIQDAVQSDLAHEALGFNVVKELVTVGRYCETHSIQDILQDARLPLCITPVPVMKDRNTLNRCLRGKDVVVGKLVKQYACEHHLQEDTVEVVVRSLNDANCFSNDNVETSEQLLKLLKQHFTPNSCTELTSLAIDEGADGSRLTHNHRMQYIFVLQSLSLWKNICRKMYVLWSIAEEDMLNPNEKYELRMTGQGLQRVQKAPKLYKAIQQVLQETKEELGEWVGSERIHLGDDQVPNAFHFIDKYGQVSRIIIPILRTLDHIDHLERHAEHAAYLREVWGGGEQAKRAILRDFFRHGFDGSGGDNMDDAGSCIDGRLTSAWNWCNNIRLKAFYPLFLFSGFSSFDGDMSL